MQSSLVPERPLVISPTLAATIGLEEAVMLHVLSELMVHRDVRVKDRLSWIELGHPDLCRAFPFWALIDIKRVQKSLQDLGLILIDPETGRQDTSWFAINQPRDDVQEQSRAVPAATTRTSAARAAHEEYAMPASAAVLNPAASQGASYIPSNWQPGEDWIKQCRQQNIPEEFVQQLVPGFVMYWRERRQARFSWGNAFYKYVLREWRQEQTRRGVSEMDTEMSTDWWPSAEAISILENAGISGTFIEDAIPEFVLYWRERGVTTGAWNTRFIEHIRRQWGKYSASIHHDTQPRRINEDWQPSPECFDILRMAEIDEEFARSKVSEFVLYWRDTNQVHASWNTRFLQFIKFQWARRLDGSQETSLIDAQDKSFTGKNQQGLGAAFQRFTDRSWAE
ncbi:MAG: DnaT-like ssDNA-binding domain-containing protein [Gammaproteobacteria bacterium]|nr:DnaT-like ssDNA-binding domain-containing protein [Gammaproteobacteria bacterium]MDP2142100.1 DnaT-like ssDNA-binding domain-containing protein [Gammaproteobacteria bacterium]MDP2347681.1 DnaT-like ssDNA-binding domain-containing protein [Gammaproteobacteria bacterium]